jgi:PIN domain nuclease of toxin-antitoxin system
MGSPVRTVDADAIVLDAQALAAYVGSEPGARAVAALLTRAIREEVILSITTVNAGEVLLSAERKGGAQASHETLDLIQDLPIDIVPVDLELAARAAWFKARGGVSFADCFAAALAHRDGVPVLTGDREFEGVTDRVQVLWLDELDNRAPGDAG